MRAVQVTVSKLYNCLSATWTSLGEKEEPRSAAADRPPFSDGGIRQRRAQSKGITLKLCASLRQIPAHGRRRQNLRRCQGICGCYPFVAPTPSGVRLRFFGGGRCRGFVTFETSIHYKHFFGVGGRRRGTLKVVINRTSCLFLTNPQN